MMQRLVSSSDSSVDDGVQDFKAAQAEQFHKLDNGTPNPANFKDAQAFKAAWVEALRADPILQTLPLKNAKPRSNSIDQIATATRTRSTQQQMPASAAHLLQLIGGDTKDAKETRQLLHSALAHLDASSRRLAHSDAERRALESAQLAQAAQSLQTASVVQQNAAEVQAQLSLAQLQLEAAQMEIERAQAVVRALEGQRDDAEHHASRARALARKLQSENRALVAREEGRKEGYEAGFAHGTVMAREQRRLEAEIEIRRQRQIAAAIPEPPPSAFIEELSGEEEGRRNVNNLSRGVSDARPAPPQAPAEARRRRETVDSVRSTEQRPGEPPPSPS
ncbi:hypothetical protein B0H13DRAFT_218623 [Mycena leptocephala]|nr:hypothetical protein B0H13DRAFT_218623 [Mycena leptocephala]